MHAFVLRTPLIASYVLAPVLGGREAELNKNPALFDLSFQPGAQFEVKSGRMGRGRFPPGGAKTQGVWRIVMWPGLEMNGEGKAIVVKRV